MSLIDKYLPHYHYAEKHAISINADATTIFNLVDELDLRQSKLIRFLFWMRGMRATKTSNAKMRESGFVELERIANREIVIGLIGQFWRGDGNMQKFAPHQFATFDTPKFLKGVWNFEILKKGNMCEVTTETRVYATDKTSHKKFSIYWIFIKPFSGIIRKEILRTIKNSAERSCTNHSGVSV